MRFIEHDDRILANIRVDKAFSLKHTVSHVFDSCFWARAILETDSIANLLAKTTADFLSDTLCDGHGGDTTRLSATYSTFVRKSVFGEVLGHLRCLP
jgi:hypothetical protein